MVPALDGTARRYGVVSAAAALLGLVALNLAPVVGEETGVGLFLAWPLAWLVALYYAAVAHRGARWAEIGAAADVRRVDGGELPTHETAVDGRRVTATARRTALVRPRFEQVLETPLEAAVDGSAVLDVGSAGVRVIEGEALVDDAVRRAAAAIEGEGRLTIDGSAGVVRLTAPGLLDDAAELRARAAAVVAVARAVTDEGGGEDAGGGRSVNSGGRATRSEGASASG